MHNIKLKIEQSSGEDHCEFSLRSLSEHIHMSSVLGCCHKSNLRHFLCNKGYYGTAMLLTFVLFRFPVILVLFTLALLVCSIVLACHLLLV